MDVEATKQLAAARRRVVIEEPCEAHGKFDAKSHVWDADGNYLGMNYDRCQGGSRRVLPEGSLIVEKVNGEWQLNESAWFVLNTAAVYGYIHGSRGLASDLFDALAAEESNQ